MPYPDLFNADKRIAIWPGWSKPEPETGYCWFVAPLEIGGVIEADFALHGGTYVHYPDQHVTFQIKVGRPGARLKVPLARIDWKSLTGGHSNRRGPHYRGLASASVNHMFMVSTSIGWKMKAGCELICHRLNQCRWKFNHLNYLETTRGISLESVT